MKKNILIIIGGYLPAKKYGGPVTSISNLVDNLVDAFDFYIVTRNHDFKEKEILMGIHEGWNDVKKARVKYLKDSDFTYFNFMKIVDEIDPECIYISSIFDVKTNWPILKIARKNKLPLLIAPRGELCENALKFNYLKKSIYLKLITLFNLTKGFYFHATSLEEFENIKKYLKTDKVFLLPNMHAKSINKNEKIKEKGVLKTIFISRIHKKKNLLSAIKIANKLSGKIILDIYGPIEEQEYWKECLLEISKSPSNIKIEYCGQIEPGQSVMLFPQYDCFFFPTLSENYGHVIAEAISCNCPVIITKNTTPWDDIDENGGFAVSLNDEEKFIKKLNELTYMDNDEFRKIKNKLEAYRETKFDTSDLVRKYIEMFNNCNIGR